MKKVILLISLLKICGFSYAMEDSRSCGSSYRSMPEKRRQSQFGVGRISVLLISKEFGSYAPIISIELKKKDLRSYEQLVRTVSDAIKKEEGLNPLGTSFEDMLHCATEVKISDANGKELYNSSYPNIRIQVRGMRLDQFLKRAVRKGFLQATAVVTVQEGYSSYA